MRFSFINTYQGLIPIERLCKLFKVSSRGLRAWRLRPSSQRCHDDAALSVHIKEQFSLSMGTYGRIRMTHELKDLGFDVGERRVARLMREHNLKVIRTHKYKVTTNSKHSYPVADNQLKREFGANRANQKWVSDISYIWTREGWLYLSVVIDLYSRRVVGWAMDDRMKSDLVVNALKMAIGAREPQANCIHHSDRGVQYCSHAYQNFLKQHGFVVSMSGKGNCYDNAACESFFKTLKAELIWRSSWETRQQARIRICEYINGFYNSRRKHSTLSYQSPINFEMTMMKKTA